MVRFRRSYAAKRVKIATREILMSDDQHGSRGYWLVKLGPEAYDRIRHARAGDIIVPRSDIEILHRIDGSEHYTIDVSRADLDAFVKFTNAYANVANMVGAEQVATEAQSLVSDYRVEMIKSEECET